MGFTLLLYKTSLPGCRNYSNRFRASSSADLEVVWWTELLLPRCRIGGSTAKITLAFGSPCCAMQWILVQCSKLMQLVVPATPTIRLSKPSLLHFLWRQRRVLITCVVAGAAVQSIGSPSMTCRWVSRSAMQLLMLTVFTLANFPRVPTSHSIRTATLATSIGHAAQRWCERTNHKLAMMTVFFCV